MRRLFFLILVILAFTSILAIGENTGSDNQRTEFSDSATCDTLSVLKLLDIKFSYSIAHWEQGYTGLRWYSAVGDTLLAKIYYKKASFIKIHIYTYSKFKPREKADCIKVLLAAGGRNLKKEEDTIIVGSYRNGYISERSRIQFETEHDTIGIDVEDLLDPDDLVFLKNEFAVVNPAVVSNVVNLERQGDCWILNSEMPRIESYSVFDMRGNEIVQKRPVKEFSVSIQKNDLPSGPIILMAEDSNKKIHTFKILNNH